MDLGRFGSHGTLTFLCLAEPQQGFNYNRIADVRQLLKDDMLKI